MTNQPPTNKGVLTDKEGTGFPGLRIDDKPWVVASYVQKYLDAIPKKSKVCYQTTDGKITKIWVDKEQGNTENCTSPDTPALKTVEGQIVALDVPAHKITVKTKDGQQHTFVWPQVMHDKMSQLKQWWFTKLTGEHLPDEDLWRLTSQEFFRRPEDWPATLGKNFGRSFQQRNDKAIILQTCLKVAADVLIARGFCEDNDPPFEEQMARITAAAIKAADEICKAGGVQ